MMADYSYNSYRRSDVTLGSHRRLFQYRQGTPNTHHPEQHRDMCSYLWAGAIRLGHFTSVFPTFDGPVYDDLREINGQHLAFVGTNLLDPSSVVEKQDLSAVRSGTRPPTDMRASSLRVKK